MRLRHLILVAAACTALPARGDPKYTLRLATVAPDGTMWAREMKALAREVEAETHGELKVKWFWGGVAGDELEVEQRLARGQLDGTASGGMTCQRLAPSLRAVRVPGLFQTRDESNYVIGRLRDLTDQEFRSKGFVSLLMPNLGPDLFFLTREVHSLAELRALKLWRWEGDDVGIKLSKAYGLNVVPMALSRALPALESGEIDGLIAIPQAMLAFRWFARVRYFLDLPSGFLGACVLVTSHAFDRLPVEHQRVLRAAAAKLRAHADLEGARQDAQLVGELFEKQGVHPLKLPPGARLEFLKAASEARDRLELLPPGLLAKVQSWLADYRAEHAEH